MIYLATFAATALLLFLGGRCAGVLRCVLVLLGLLLPCFLAGFRDPSIGTDVYSYAIWMWEDASSLDLAGFLQTYDSVAALGWNVATWIVCGAGVPLGLYLFAIEAFCIAPVYFALRKLAPGGEWAGMLAWLLVFYAFSLNAMRQSVAIGLVLCSVVCIVQRNPARFLLCVIGACLFHQTAVIAVVLYPLARAVGWGRRAMFGKWQTVVLAVLILFAFGFIVAFGDRLVVLASMLKDSYSYQVNHIGSGDIGFSYLYVTICCLGIYLISRDDFGSSDTTEGEGKSLFDRMRVFKACSAIACVGGLMWQLNYVADTLGRLGAYGMVLLCVMAALLAANGRRSRGHLAVALSLFAVYFVAAVMVLGMEEVYPYASAILGLG